jgi:hypothetical protein
MTRVGPGCATGFNGRMNSTIAGASMSSWNAASGDYTTNSAEELIDHLSRQPMPLMVFSRNLYSWFGYAIAKETRGVYNHFMWLISPATLATQDWTFRRCILEEYLTGKHAVKFIGSDSWSGAARAMLLAAIRRDLLEPWLDRLYDPIQLIGHKIGMPWLQIPGLNICSDRGRYLKSIDIRYSLSYPTPSDINMWSKGTPGYRVVARYLPIDV